MLDLVEIAEEVAGRFCLRCAWRHPVWPPSPSHTEYEHGTDYIPNDEGAASDVYAGPQPCDAAAIWELLERLAGNGTESETLDPTH